MGISLDLNDDRIKLDYLSSEDKEKNYELEIQVSPDNLDVCFCLWVDGSPLALKEVGIEEILYFIENYNSSHLP